MVPCTLYQVRLRGVPILLTPILPTDIIPILPTDVIPILPTLHLNSSPILPKTGVYIKYASHKVFLELNLSPINYYLFIDNIYHI